MKTQKIVAPEGYEIDREKSTIDEIVFKEIKKQLPQTWEELNTIKGWYVDSYAVLNATYSVPTKKDHKTIFPTKEQAEASIALAQLSQLRDVYRNGWEPNWDDDSWKFCIQPYNNSFDIILVTHACYFLSFPTKEIAQEFLNNFRDLIEQAKPLMS